VRDNDIEGGGLYGGLFYTSSGADQTLQQLIVAGNTLDSTGQLWGGVTMAGSTAGSSATTEISFADIVENAFSGKVYGGVMYGYYSASSYTSSGSSATHNVYETDIVSNTTSGTTYGCVYYSTSSHSTSTFEYNNIYDNTGTDFYNRTDPTGSSGNVAADPDYLDVSSTDPADWDLELSATSPVRDAGDPSLADIDGSVCDIGAYGGSDGGGW
jgi:hypothetical protein